MSDFNLQQHGITVENIVRNPAVPVLCEQALQLARALLAPGGVKGTRGARCEQMLGKALAKQVVHAGGRVAHRHGAQGIAMVPATDC